MTKLELAMRVHARLRVRKSLAYKVVDGVLSEIFRALVRGENVELRNFGVFRRRKWKSRLGRNPKRPGQEVVIPDRWKVTFKMGKHMKDKIAKENYAD